MSGAILVDVVCGQPDRTGTAAGNLPAWKVMSGDSLRAATQTWRGRNDTTNTRPSAGAN